MLHYKTILICCAVFAVLKLNNGEVFSSSSHLNTTFRSNDYISINRRQYERTIQTFNAKLEMFKQVYNERLYTLDIQQEMLVDSLKINDEHLNPMEILSDFSKHCVGKYRSQIPTVESAKEAVQLCIANGRNQLNSLISSPLTTRNNLQNYYKNTFEKEVINCEKKHTNTLTFNYTNCLTNLISMVNVATLSNQKAFNTQIETSQCSANAHLKKAVDCSFLSLNRTLSFVAESKNFINKCLENLNSSDKLT